jgi:hypothetical protein
MTDTDCITLGRNRLLLGRLLLLAEYRSRSKYVTGTAAFKKMPDDTTYVALFRKMILMHFLKIIKVIIAITR